MSLLTGEPVSADVVAMQESVISILPQYDAERVLSSVPAFGRHLAVTLAYRLEQANLSIWDIHRRQQALQQFLRHGYRDLAPKNESTCSISVRTTWPDRRSHAGKAGWRQRFQNMVRAAEPYEVSCRSGENAKESSTHTANSNLRLINRAVWRGDDNITSVPGASIILGVMYTF